MTSWADNESELARARELLADRFPDTSPAIIDTFDIAWQGWDGDSKGALITVDGVPMLVAIDQTIDEGRFESEIVKQLAEYKRLFADTERVLKRYRELSGTVDHVERNGGDKPEIRGLKRQLSRSIVYATEAASEWDQAAFLRGMGFQQDWMIYAFDTPARVPLCEFVQVYDAAAAKAGWQSLHAIVREVTQRQRFKEWPEDDGE